MRSHRNWTVAVFAVMVVSAMLGGILFAHHGRAGYADSDSMITLEGVVSGVVWRNPHVFVQYDVTDDEGKVVTWMGEFSSLQTMMSEGMSRNSFKVGDEVSVTSRPAIGGSPHGLVNKIETTDGRVSIDLSARRGGGEAAAAQ